MGEIFDVFDIFDKTPILDLFLDWRIWAAVILLASLTVFFSVAKYRVGRDGIATVKEHFPQVTDERWERVGSYFERYGSPVVFLSFLPFLTWIIPPAAGAYGIRFRPFLFWAFIAKMVRYWLLIIILVVFYELIF
jgi:membrane protein YqaA with SNARE-associated domain